MLKTMLKKYRGAYTERGETRYISKTAMYRKLKQKHAKRGLSHAWMGAGVAGKL